MDELGRHSSDTTWHQAHGSSARISLFQHLDDILILLRLKAIVASMDDDQFPVPHRRSLPISLLVPSYPLLDLISSYPRSLAILIVPEYDLHSPLRFMQASNPSAGRSVRVSAYSATNTGIPPPLTWAGP